MADPAVAARRGRDGAPARYRPRMPTVAPPEELVRELEVLVRAHHPLLLFETVEEERLRSCLGYVADRVGLPLFTWDGVRGLEMQTPDGGRPPGTHEPEKALAFIEDANLEALFFLPDFPELEGPTATARVKRIYRRYFQHRGQVVLSGPAVRLPPSLEPLFTLVDLPAPSVEAYHGFVQELIRALAKELPVQVALSPEDATVLFQALHGLTLSEVEKIISRAVVEDGRLDRRDLETILAAKRKVIERSGLLEYFPHDQRLRDVAGLARLKEWLRKRHGAFADAARARDFGLTPPKGLLLIGVQGCGKSLCAKAVAAEWRLPLLRLDPGRLYEKYFGESERNLRRAIGLAESMAPVVLWIDEIEKAVGTGEGSADGGTSQRILGSFLAWLQEKRESVFVIATANDISNLPPELLRKGRFDEIFFVDLPSGGTREEIFAVHLAKRNRRADDFDLAALAAASDGFSGAEIEQAVVSALYDAFERDDGSLTTDDVLRELATTRPLSVTMAERIQSLRGWALERCVPAD